MRFLGGINRPPYETADGYLQPAGQLVLAVRLLGPAPNGIISEIPFLIIAAVLLMRAVDKQ